MMKIKAIGDGNSDFEKVYLKSDWPDTIETPHCKEHGAMNKVAVFTEGTGAIWRCCTTEKQICRAGCEQIYND